MNPRIKTFEKDDDMPAGLIKVTVMLKTSTQRHVYEVKAQDGFPLNLLVPFLISEAKREFYKHLS